MHIYGQKSSMFCNLMVKIQGNFKILWKLLFPTLILFFAAACLFFPVFYLKIKTPVYMGRFFPEVVLFILSFEIITIFFLNYFVTAISTHLFLNERSGIHK